jgi:hypothetical protein
MTAASQTFADTLGPFFGVVARGSSYRNTLYSLLAFPLGITYFILLTVGLSLGLGLAILWIGLFILALVLVLTWALSAFERQQAIVLLDADIGPMGERPEKGSPISEKLSAFLGNRVTWTGPMFLFLKFPLGVFSFCFGITALALNGALLSAPLIYRWEPLDFYWWYVDTLPEALLCSLIGALGFVITLHAFNGLGWIWRELATLMLGQTGPLAVENAGGGLDDQVDVLAGRQSEAAAGPLGDGHGDVEIVDADRGPDQP